MKPVTMEICINMTDAMLLVKLFEDLNVLENLQFAIQSVEITLLLL